ncbi:MAG: hypothetical protein OXP71_17980 [Candidatus Poribacteria bacterium]|nr:hypothetical protein [Candidatus Poribacteria bacterium]
MKHSDLRDLPLSVQYLTTPVGSAVGQVENKNVADGARRILWILTEISLTFQSRGVDLDCLPQIHAFSIQDGSLLIEWIFDDFRVGFSIEPIPSESSWYLVSNAKLGDISVAGHISQHESETQILMSTLLTFIILHV